MDARRLDGADAVVIATEWPEFAEIDLPAARDAMRQAKLFDGRGLIRPADAVAAGLAYRGVGRRSLEPSATTARA